MKTMGYMFSYFLGSSPRDLKTKIKWNKFLTYSHTWWHICHVCKVVGTSFQWIIVPRSREQSPKKDQNFMHQDLRVWHTSCPKSILKYIWFRWHWGLRRFPHHTIHPEIWNKRIQIEEKKWYEVAIHKNI